MVLIRKTTTSQMFLKVVFSLSIFWNMFYLSYLMDGCEVDGAALEAGAEAQVSLYPAVTAGPAPLTSQPVQPHHSPAYHTNIFPFRRRFFV